MNHRTLLAAAALFALVAPAQAEVGNLLACAVPSSADGDRLALCSGRVSVKHPVWTFVLRGIPPNLVTRIEIMEEGKDLPRQVLKGFEARPPFRRGDGRDPGRIDVILQDVDFDNRADLRIAIGPPDDEGTSYRWFQFDKESDLFVATDALDMLKSPILNPRRRVVLGAFRDERGREGRMAFRWRGGRLEPVAAIARERTDDGRCIATHYRLVEGKFERLRETECRPGEAPPEE